jgi:hypothetical protein
MTDNKVYKWLQCQVKMDFYPYHEHPIEYLEDTICTIIRDGNKITDINCLEIIAGDKIVINKDNYTETVIYAKIINAKKGCPCVSSNCIVTILNINNIPEEIQIKNLQIGDYVKTPKGFIPVKCIMKTEIEDGEIVLCCHKNGLAITHKHPVKHQSIWEHPYTLNEYTQRIVKTSHIYSIGLDGAESLYVNDIEVIAIGHNIQNDDIATHNFLGTSAIINRIFELSPSGYLTIKCENIIRDSSGIIGID